LLGFDHIGFAKIGEVVKELVQVEADFIIDKHRASSLDSSLMPLSLGHQRISSATIH
jgi:hypothetical protein